MEWSTENLKRITSIEGQNPFMLATVLLLFYRKRYYFKCSKRKICRNYIRTSGYLRNRNEETDFPEISIIKYVITKFDVTIHSSKSIFDVCWNISFQTRFCCLPLCVVLNITFKATVRANEFDFMKAKGRCYLVNEKGILGEKELRILSVRVILETQGLLVDHRRQTCKQRWTVS